MQQKLNEWHCVLLIMWCTDHSQCFVMSLQVIAHIETALALACEHNPFRSPPLPLTTDTVIIFYHNITLPYDCCCCCCSWWSLVSHHEEQSQSYIPLPKEHSLPSNRDRSSSYILRFCCCILALGSAIATENCRTHTTHTSLHTAHITAAFVSLRTTATATAVTATATAAAASIM